MMTEPTMVNYFALNIDGIEMFDLTSVSGLARQITPSRHLARNSAGKPVELVVPGGRNEPGVLQCEGYLHPGDAVSKWFFRIAAGVGELKNGALFLYKYDGALVQTWTLVNLWPSNLSYGELDAMGDGVPMGSVTFQFDRLEVG